LRLPKTAVGLLCLLGFVVLNQSHCHGQSVCLAEMEEWRAALVQLQEALGETEKIKDASVAEIIRERVSRRKPGENMADVIRSVLEQKAAQVDESQKRCLALAEQEKTAYQTLNKCASHSTSRRDPSIGLRIRELAKEREKAMRDLKYVMTEEAYIQYLNQRPLTQDDYSYDRQSFSRAWSGAKADR